MWNVPDGAYHGVVMMLALHHLQVSRVGGFRRQYSSSFGRPISATAAAATNNGDLEDLGVVILRFPCAPVTVP